jgi:hypothetical protein
MELNNLMSSVRCQMALYELSSRRAPGFQTRDTSFKGIVQMTMPKSVELTWHCEVIERWLNTPGIPSEAREELLVMHRDVKQEMETLEHRSMTLASS